MTININKQYRTRDGRAVRIYAVCAAGRYPVHGATYRAEGEDESPVWVADSWTAEGKFLSLGNYGLDLIEVTLADEIRDQIPWEMLKPHVRWIAFHPVWGWRFCTSKKRPEWNGTCWADPEEHGWYELGPIVMPEVDPARWREILVWRPDDR